MRPDHRLAVVSVPARVVLDVGAQTLEENPIAAVGVREAVQAVPRRRRHLERTRQDILEATAEVVAVFGYQGSRIEEICTRAGISRGAFYHHFPSKEAAIVALIERNLAPLIEEATRIERVTVEDRVRMIAMEMAAIMRWVGSGGPIARAFFVEMMGVPEAEALRGRLDAEFQGHLLETLGPLFASGELISSDVSATFQAFAGMTKETAAAWVQGRLPDLERAIGEVVRMALVGIGVDPARAGDMGEAAAAYRPAW